MCAGLLGSRVVIGIMWYTLSLLASLTWGTPERHPTAYIIMIVADVLVPNRPLGHQQQPCILAPSQWEKLLQSNAVSHWLGASMHGPGMLIVQWLQNMIVAYASHYVIYIYIYIQLLNKQCSWEVGRSQTHWILHYWWVHFFTAITLLCHRWFLHGPSRDLLADDLSLTDADTRVLSDGCADVARPSAVPDTALGRSSEPRWVAVAA